MGRKWDPVKFLILAVFGEQQLILRMFFIVYRRVVYRRYVFVFQRPL